MEQVPFDSGNGLALVELLVPGEGLLHEDRIRALPLHEEPAGLLRVGTFVCQAASASQNSGPEVNRFFNRLPKQKPPPLEIQHGSEFVRFLQAAHARQKEARSAFLGEQHLLAALADHKNLMKALSSEAGLTKKMLLSGIASVTSKGGEKTVEFLNL